MSWEQTTSKTPQREANRDTSTWTTGSATGFQFRGRYGHQLDKPTQAGGTVLCYINLFLCFCWKQKKFFFKYLGSFWRRKWQPLQYSCLENPMGRGAWWATDHRVAKSWARLKRLRSCSTRFIYLFVQTSMITNLEKLLNYVALFSFIYTIKLL